MHTIIRDNYTPQLNEYHEKIIVDPTRRKTWLFDCDGVFTDITKINVVSERGGSEEYAASQKWLTEELEALEAADVALQDNIDAEETARIAADETLQDNIDAEEADRIASDTEIWDEIETIEAASDVVDIVGTKAELDDYDTSKLTDEDIIKVLQDETKEDATTYYRWDKANNTFTYVGEEGPYYTQTQVDTLLNNKVDKTSVTSTPSFNPSAASETLVMSQKGVAKQVLNENNGGIQISSAAGNASAGAPVAVAIGPDATASASPSVAIGYQSKAGNVSTALGSGAKAENASALALGYNAEAAGFNDVSIGSSASTRVSSGSQTSNNVAIGSSGVAANGGSSFAAGSRYVEATGPGSIAIGGASSFADRTLASGSSSLAVGQISSATGGSSVAIGLRAVANGNGDMAIGHNCTTSSASSGTAIQNIAVGQSASATGGYSTAFGNIAVASGDSSFAAGARVNATATHSMAIGHGNPNNEVEASGFYSLAIGTNGAKASGSNSMAIGGSSTAPGSYAVAIGAQNCTASHYNSVALGAFSQTGRSDEISIGTPISGSFPEKTKYIAHVTAGVNDTDAVNVKQLNDGLSSKQGTLTAGTGISIDANNVISSTSTAALYSTTGQNTDGAMTQKAVTDTLFENNDTARIKIGSGVVNSGAASIVIGSQGTQVLTPNSIAIGNGGTTSGSSGGSGNNVAIGSYGISATGGQSVAIGGNGAMATAEAAIAIGSNGAKASGENSIAIGRSTMASHKDSVALGTNAVTGRTSEISLGTNASGMNPEKTKYIAHVTAGVNNTDAVNVAQLNAAIPGVMTGATSSAAGASGLVPAPAAGDETKYLAGDGTWKTVSASSVTIFYNNFDSSTATMYSDSAMTAAVKGEDIESAFNQGKVIICCVSSGWNRYIEATGLLYYSWNTSMLIVETALRSDRVLLWFAYADKATTSCTRTSQTLQQSFTIGSNLSWSGNTLNATDTTYSDFGGATSSAAGTSGLVPAPAAGDEDKYLKGDGTWAAASGGPQITMTDTDPGEGGTLAADNYIFVYDGGGNV